MVNVWALLRPGTLLRRSIALLVQGAVIFVFTWALSVITGINSSTGLTPDLFATKLRLRSPSSSNFACAATVPAHFIANAIKHYHAGRVAFMQEDAMRPIAGFQSTKMATLQQLEEVNQCCIA